MAEDRERVIEELERELASTRKQLGDCLAILRMTPDIVYKVDPEGHFVFLSDSIRELGYAPEELLGKHFSVLVHEEDVEAVSRSSVLPKYTGRVTGDTHAPKLFDERRTGRRRTKNLVLRLNTKAGEAPEGEVAGTSPVYGEVMATGHYDGAVESESKRFLGTVGTIREIGPEPHVPAAGGGERGAEGDHGGSDDRGGVLDGTVGVIRDVTERRRLERQKTELQNRLFQARKMEAVGQLAAGIAHDFNNMLGAISGYADLLSRKLADRDPKLAKYARTILAGANRAAGLTSKLLTFARRGKYRSLAVDIHLLLREVMAALRGTVESGVILKEELSASTAQVLGDPDQLRDALLDVAVNARDALPEDGEIVFSTSVISVDEAFSRAHNLDCAYPDYLVVSIRDTGVGMDEETAGRVFEPFFTTKELGKGTGLGLASSYGVVEAHRGTMEIESAPGRGTTVRIYLPLLRQESPTSPDGPYRALADDQGRSKRIMVIDDEEIFLEACGDMLEALGYETVTFRSPRHAIERFREDHDDIDLVVIDMVMPGIAGGECFRRLKQIDPDIKALVATGHALEDAADRLLADGVAGFMRKPFVMEQLAEAVGRVLGAGD